MIKVFIFVMLLVFSSLAGATQDKALMGCSTGMPGAGCLLPRVQQQGFAILNFYLCISCLRWIWFSTLTSFRSGSLFLPQEVAPAPLRLLWPSRFDQLRVSPWDSGSWCELVGSAQSSFTWSEGRRHTNERTTPTEFPFHHGNDGKTQAFSCVEVVWTCFENKTSAAASDLCNIEMPSMRFYIVHCANVQFHSAVS